MSRSGRALRRRRSEHVPAAGPRDAAGHPRLDGTLSAAHRQRAGVRDLPRSLQARPEGPGRRASPPPARRPASRFTWPARACSAANATWLSPAGRGCRCRSRRATSTRRTASSRRTATAAPSTPTPGARSWGAASAIVVVKRLSDALRDGDAIRAVIKGTAINNDGADKIGFTAPGVSGQETVIRQALEMADVDAATIGYVEAHGTGTFLGDPIEVEALTRAYRRRHGRRRLLRDRLGQDEHRPSRRGRGDGGRDQGGPGARARGDTAQPQLQRSQPADRLRREPVPGRRPPDARGRASSRRGGPRVSSFGLGGTNAHVVLEQAPAADRSAPSPRDHQLFVVSGRTEGSLDRGHTRARRAPGAPARARAGGRRAHAGGGSPPPADATGGRGIRLPAGGAGAARCCSSVPPATRSATARRVFMFPGGGAQYVGMGQRLHATEPEFRRAFDRCADLCERSLGANLRALVFGAGEPADARAPRPRAARPVRHGVRHGAPARVARRPAEHHDRPQPGGVHGGLPGRRDGPRGRARPRRAAWPAFRGAARRGDDQRPAAGGRPRAPAR